MLASSLARLTGPGVLRNTKTYQIVQSAVQHDFSTTQPMNELQLRSTVKVVDNSLIGRKAMDSGKKVRIIHVYNKQGIARVGDKVLVSIEKQKKMAYIVGCVQKQKPMQPQFDTNNAVLIDENGTPIGTRIRVPIPSHLRAKDGDFTKILSIAKSFV